MVLNVADFFQTGSFHVKQKAPVMGNYFLAFLMGMSLFKYDLNTFIAGPLLYPNGNGSELPDDPFQLDLVGVPLLGSSDALFMFQSVQK